MPVITVDSVSKRYPHRGMGRLGRKREETSALSGVSFSVAAGEAVGIIGSNGSGKSTLLKILCGITAPSAGKVTVEGRVAALLELGVGFHPEYTGLENIYLNGALYGQSRKETEEKIPRILEFADIGDFINRPVKTYSDGMFLRLAFAAMIETDPRILVVDEALAVGDLAFQAKCFTRLRELKEKGCTLLYVSHDPDSIRRLCDRVLWLEGGRLCMDGKTEAVTGAYLAHALGQGSTRHGNRFGDQTGAILSVDAPSVWQYGSPVSVTVRFSLPPLPEEEIPVLSLAMKNREGLDLLVLSTAEHSLPLRPQAEQAVTFTLKSPFCHQDLLLAVGLEYPCRSPITYLDYWGDALTVKAQADPSYFGEFHLSWEVTFDEKTTG